jgi:hypothetical protein
VLTRDSYIQILLIITLIVVRYINYRGAWGLAVVVLV